MLNSYHVEIDKFVDKILAAKPPGKDGVLLVKHKEDSWNYGVIDIDGQKIKGIVEKPKQGETYRIFVLSVFTFFQSHLSKLLKRLRLNIINLKKPWIVL